MDLEQLENESQRIRNLRKQVIYMFIGFPFFGIAVIWVLTRFGFSEYGAIPIIILYMIIYLVQGFRVSNVNCPVCHGAMFRKWFFYSAGSSCVHCGYDLKDYKSSKFHKW